MSTGATMETLADPLTCAARLLLALLFLHEGWLKIDAYADVAGYMEAHGVPGSLLPLVILTELGGGLLIALGLGTRAAALALAGFCTLAAVLFHSAADDPGGLTELEKDLAIAGGFLALAARGAGRWSLDAGFSGAVVGRRARGRA